MEKAPSKKLPLFGILVVFIIIAAFLSSIIFVLKDVELKPLPDTQVQPDVTEREIGTDAVVERQTGVITGSLGYPSEMIPVTMEICAIDILFPGIYCTDEHLQDSSFTYGVGYRLEVPASDYYVFAQVPNQPDATGETYKAYYSEFVTCGCYKNPNSLLRRFKFPVESKEVLHK
ncbi:MAG: hypothetical protein UV49_C0011G0020 [candidate division WWE3 bacterium GW2011_GWA2_42_9]|nr:MAG: hypothetical protein UV49_C0011G0020 [candidate division WWE3 bacterium GW2011_GWA2_42_9]